MALATDPTVLTGSYADMQRSVDNSNITQLGACDNSSPPVSPPSPTAANSMIEMSYDQLNNKFFVKALAGPAPTVQFAKYNDWKLLHGAHALSHMGNIVIGENNSSGPGGTGIGPTGFADVYYCQVDNIILFDDKT